MVFFVTVKLFNNCFMLSFISYNFAALYTWSL